MRKILKKNVSGATKLAGVAALASLIMLGSVVGATTVDAASTKNWKFLGDYSNRDDAFAAAEAVEIEMNEEGMILLKNQGNALPISKDSKITIFGEDGADYYEALVGGGFTGVNPNLLSPDAVTSSAYGVNSITREQEQSLDFYGDVGIICIDRDGISEGQDAKEKWDYEADEIFTEGGEFEHEALVTTGGKTYQHQLMPTSTELDLVDYAIAHCQKVIILIGAANTMELEAFEENDGVDAIMWCGQYGDNGLKALPKLLSGEVSPSARTSDFFEADFTSDPTWYNYGDYSQIFDSEAYKASAGANKTALSKNWLMEEDGEGGWQTHVWERKAGKPSMGPPGMGGGEASKDGIPVVMYEEGVYYGYKYWETAHTDGYLQEVYGGTAEEAWDRAVTYPFGYGLSYTSFEWELVDVDDSLWDEWAKQTGETYSPEWTGSNCWTITVKVRVTNTGNYPGKDVVEAYFHAPYFENGVSKPEVSLVGFEKTCTLNPGESEVVTITLNAQDMASFDYDDKNGNENTVYEFEANADATGIKDTSSPDYEIRFQKNSHENVLTHKLADLQTDIVLDKDYFSGNDVENIFSQDNIYNTLGWDYKYDEQDADKDDPSGWETLEERGDMVQLSRDDYAGTHPKNTPLYQENMRRSDYYFYFIEFWQAFDADGDDYFNESYGNGTQGAATGLYNTENDNVAAGIGAAEMWYITKEVFDEKTNPNGEDGVAWTQVENDGATGTAWEQDKDEQNLEGATLPTIMWRDMLGIACWGNEGQAVYTYDENATENSEATHTRI